jgi:hypothetical protein
MQAPLTNETTSVHPDRPSGVLLIIGAIVGMVVIILHPSGIVNPATFAGFAWQNQIVHGVALGVPPILLLGLLGLSRRLGASDLTTAALLAYALGAVAVVSAAVSSGFVATLVIQQILTGAAEARPVFQALLTYTDLVNQGFAKVNAASGSASVLLWCAAIWRSGRIARAPAVAGAVVNVALLLALFAGALPMDVHGFGLVTLAQSVWLAWIGVLLCREGGVR